MQLTQNPLPDDSTVLVNTRHWLEKVVIGLNLCPFAKAVYLRHQVRLVVSQATSEEALLEELAQELALLAATNPAKTDTTLLIHPKILQDFLDYNDFLDSADAVVEQLELEGELQVASFHPEYQFDGTGPNDIENFTNRSPYPTLHLLREESVTRAVATYAQTDQIYEKNIQTLRALGFNGWQALMQTQPALVKAP